MHYAKPVTCLLLCSTLLVMYNLSYRLLFVQDTKVNDYSHYKSKRNIHISNVKECVTRLILGNNLDTLYHCFQMSINLRRT